MKVVILAGGKGTRLLEETATIPKPMLRVGEQPLLHHIMDIYRGQGYSDFIIPVGYKSEHVFGHFYSLGPAAATLIQDGVCFEWEDVRVTVIDTGENTQTGGRLGRIRRYLTQPFHFTYGDGLGDVNVKAVEDAHRDSKDIVTLTTVHPEGRFGRAIVDDHGKVIQFGEKIENQTDWINGGFAVISPNIVEGIHGDDCNLEKDLYPDIAERGLMSTLHHTGYWKCVDTLRDLEDIRQAYEKTGAIWLT